MKRSEALAPLSRDHHQGLYAALNLRRATPAGAAGARDAFLAFWHADGRHHFAVEDDVLFPLIESTLAHDELVALGAAIGRAA